MADLQSDKVLMEEELREALAGQDQQHEKSTKVCHQISAMGCHPITAVICHQIPAMVCHISQQLDKCSDFELDGINCYQTLISLLGWRLIAGATNTAPLAV